MLSARDPTRPTPLRPRLLHSRTTHSLPLPTTLLWQLPHTHLACDHWVLMSFTCLQSATCLCNILPHLPLWSRNQRVRIITAPVKVTWAPVSQTLCQNLTALNGNFPCPRSPRLPCRTCSTPPLDSLLCRLRQTTPSLAMIWLSGSKNELFSARSQR